MIKNRFAIRIRDAVTVAAIWGCMTPFVSAQTSSLLQQPPPAQQGTGIGQPGVPMMQAQTYDPNRGVPAMENLLPTPTMVQPMVGTSPNSPIYLQAASWTHQPPPPVRVFRKNDIITIRVDETAQVLAEGGAETRKQAIFQTVLQDWIRLQNFRLRPDPQANGDPTVAASSNNQFRAEATVETRESVVFNIAAKIVDIRPNGTILLEARKSIRVNGNLWETSLSGACRATDVGPDNVVLSRDLIDLEVHKDDHGDMRQGYKRGWFQRAIDRFSPF